MAPYFHNPSSSSSSSTCSCTMFGCRHSRVELMKKRYAGIIDKAKKALDDARRNDKGRKRLLDDDDDERKGSKKMMVKKDANSNSYSCSNVHRKEAYSYSNVHRNVMKEEKRKVELQKKREAARREIEGMRNTGGICDPWELTRDIEKMLGYSITGQPPNLSFRWYQVTEENVEELEEGEIRE